MGLGFDGRGHFGAELVEPLIRQAGEGRRDQAGDKLRLRLRELAGLRDRRLNHVHGVGHVGHGVEAEFARVGDRDRGQFVGRGRAPQVHGEHVLRRRPLEVGQRLRDFGEQVHLVAQVGQLRDAGLSDAPLRGLAGGLEESGFGQGAVFIVEDVLPDRVLLFLARFDV